MHVDYSPTRFLLAYFLDSGVNAVVEFDRFVQELSSPENTARGMIRSVLA